MATPRLDTKTQRVFRGFAHLDATQRSNLVEWLNEYQGATSGQREVLLGESRSALKMITGPAGEGCPCCGR